MQKTAEVFLTIPSAMLYAEGRFHTSSRKYTLMRDDIQPKGLMRSPCGDDIPSLRLG